VAIASLIATDFQQLQQVRFDLNDLFMDFTYKLKSIWSVFKRTNPQQIETVEFVL